MIEHNQRQCGICCSSTPIDQFYSVADCSHQFCFNCCTAHIDAKLDSFTEVKCLETKCNKRLTPETNIFKLLSSSTKSKFKKYTSSILIQKNKNLKPCQKQNCHGYIQIKQKKPKKKLNQLKLKPQKETVACSQCHSEHCPECYQLSHMDQPCKKDSKEQEQDKMMTALRYRRCPNCQIWVQKKGGCQYLNCKCGCQFCYICGVQFNRDPCRKMVDGIFIDEQVMTALKRLKFRHPETIIEKILIPFKLILIVLVFCLINILPILIFVISLAILTPLIVILSPGFLTFLYKQIFIEQSSILLARILTIIFYPVVGCLIACAFIFILLTYPILRFFIPSRLYDSMDEKLARICIWYLKICSCLFEL